MERLLVWAQSPRPPLVLDALIGPGQQATSQLCDLHGSWLLGWCDGAWAVEWAYGKDSPALLPVLNGMWIWEGRMDPLPTPEFMRWEISGAWRRPTTDELHCIALGVLGEAWARQARIAPPTEVHEAERTGARIAEQRLTWQEPDLERHRQAHGRWK